MFKKTLRSLLTPRALMLCGILALALFVPDFFPHAHGVGFAMFGIIGFDVFKQDAFSSMQLVAAVEKVPYLPSYLGDLKIFLDNPVRTPRVFIEERDGELILVQTSPRGSPAGQRVTENRKAFAFQTSRISQKDHVMADELLGIRAFGSETETIAVQNEVARRLSGPTGLQRYIEYTWENMRLGAVQGILLDADGSTIYNFFTEFGISQPSEVAFDLTGARKYDTTTGIGVLRQYIQANVVRPMIRAAKGAFLPTTKIYGLCGDAFYDDLTNHGEVRTTYLNWLQAQSLRDGNAFEEFPYGGINWVNYRGSDDASTIGVNTDKVKFFPVGAPGVFQVSWAPAEFLPYVGSLGMPLYPMIITDDERQAYVDIELYSYPLFMCTRPEVLYSGRRGS